MDNIAKILDKYSYLKGINLDWLIDLIYNKKIKIDISHNTYDSNSLMSMDSNIVFDRFLWLFGIDIKSYTKCNMIDMVKNGEMPLIKAGNTCKDCGEEIGFIFDGKSIKELVYNIEKRNYINTGKCKKIGTYSVDISFPSGKLICLDNLPYYIEVLGDMDGEHSLNSNLGVSERTINFSKKNVLHMLVGNTCPSVYYSEEANTILIGIPELDDDDYKIPLLKNSEEITFVITDLWWISIVDAEIYKKLLINKFGEKVGLLKFNEIPLIEKTIKPGAYKCTYLNNNNFDEIEAPATFIKMELIQP